MKRRHTDTNVQHSELDTLVLAARDGDQAAFSALITSHYRLVHGLAWSAVGDWSAAEDIAQDTFVVAWTHLNKLRTPGAFPMWIRKIARNLAYTWHRSAKYRCRLAETQQSQAGEPVAPTEGAADRIAREERLLEIWRALNSLRPPLREALVLFYLEKHSVTEGARALGITENAFKLRLHHGRAKLRAYFSARLEERLVGDLSAAPVKAPTQRILAGMIVGPALPYVGDAVSNAGWSLWIHQLTHSGLSGPAGTLVKGGVLMKKASVIVGLVTILCLGGALWMFTSAHHAPAPTAAAPDRTPSSSTAAPLTASLPDTSAPNAASTLYRSPEPAPAAIGGDAALLTDKTVLTLSGMADLSKRNRIDDPNAFASISGVITDSRGNPVPNAEITVGASGLDSDVPRSGSREDYFTAFVARQSADHRFTARSGPVGAYSVTGIAYRGSAQVTAYAEGLVQTGATRVTLEPGAILTEVNIVMAPGVMLKGRLLSVSGAPVNDGVVQVVSHLSRVENRIGLIASAVTNSQGFFRLAFDREGTATIVASSITHGKSSFDDVPIDGTDIVELRMKPSASVTGAIHWGDGAPAAGTIVCLAGNANDSQGQYRAPGTVITADVDSQGQYLIKGVDAGEMYTAEVWRRDRTTLSPPVPLGKMAPGITVRWDYTVQDPIVVTGRVLGEKSGKPLRNVRVACLKDGKPLQGADVPVDDAGRYTLQVLSGPGNYFVYPRVARPGPAEPAAASSGRDVALSPGQELELDLKLLDLVTMSVRVVDGQGKPLPGLMVNVKEGQSSWGPAGKTDSEGRFTWAGFNSGVEAGFKVYRTGELVGETPSRIGEPGEVFPEDTIVLHGSAALRGIAVGPSGDPIAGGLVKVTVDTGSGSPLQRFANLDDDGYFLISGGLPSTQVTLKLTAYGQGTHGVDQFGAAVGPMELVDGQTTDLGAIVFKLEQADLDI